MIFLAQNNLTTFGLYSTAAAFINYIRSEFSASLDLIYSLQNEINLS